jgi:hypothetical protein
MTMEDTSKSSLKRWHRPTYQVKREPFHGNRHTEEQIILVLKDIQRLVSSTVYVGNLDLLLLSFIATLFAHSHPNDKTTSHWASDIRWGDLPVEEQVEQRPLPIRPAIGVTSRPSKASMINPNFTNPVARLDSQQRPLEISTIQSADDILKQADALIRRDSHADVM